MLLKNNALKLLEIFIENPSKEFHLRELSRLTKLSTTAITKNMKILTMKDLVLRESKDLYTAFRANKQNSDFKDMKRLHNIMKIRNSGLLSFLVKEFKYPETIILFGSVSRGEDDEKSDIDMFILGNMKDINLVEYEKRLGKSINILVMDRNKFDEAKRKNPEMINNIINGIIIEGYLKVL